MLTYLLKSFNINSNFLNILRFPASFIVSFLSSIFLCSFLIRYFRLRRIGEEIRNYIPNTHQIKAQTPTMGGIAIFFSSLLTTLLFFNFNERFTYIIPIISSLFFILGFLDDFLKRVLKSKDGLLPIGKILFQVIICFLIIYYIYFYLGESSYHLVMPFNKNIRITIPLFAYIILLLFVVIGSSNAVNLTDGIDGLAVSTFIINFLFFSIIAAVSSNRLASMYFKVSYIRGAPEIFLYLISLMGTLLGFLWYNCYPAQIFMGDTGSLMLGGILGFVAILLKSELYLPLIGLIFVIETLSVIVQKISYRLLKRPLFKMAPLHHHFELCGLKETKITGRAVIN